MINFSHPAGLDPIGFYKSGRPIYPIMGGSVDAAPSSAPDGGDVRSDQNGRTQSEKSDAEQRTSETSPDAEQRSDADDNSLDHWKAQSRRWERQAQANADAARELAALKESEKTELQKAVDRAAAAETELTALRTESMKRKAAAKHGISEDDLQFLHGDDETSLDAAAKKLAERINGNGRSKGPRDPGRTPTDKGKNAADARETVRTLFGRD